MNINKEARELYDQAELRNRLDEFGKLLFEEAKRRNSVYGHDEKTIHELINMNLKAAISNRINYDSKIKSLEEEVSRLTERNENLNQEICNCRTINIKLGGNCSFGGAI